MPDFFSFLFRSDLQKNDQLTKNSDQNNFDVVGQVFIEKFFRPQILKYHNRSGDLDDDLCREFGEKVSASFWDYVKKNNYGRYPRVLFSISNQGKIEALDLKFWSSLCGGVDDQLQPVLNAIKRDLLGAIASSCQNQNNSSVFVIQETLNGKTYQKLCLAKT